MRIVKEYGSPPRLRGRCRRKAEELHKVEKGKEKKVNSDADAYYAIVQLLTYLSELSSDAQTTRASRFLFNSGLEVPARYDLHILLGDYNNRRKKGPLAEATKSGLPLQGGAIQHSSGAGTRPRDVPSHEHEGVHRSAGPSVVSVTFRCIETPGLSCSPEATNGSIG